MTSAALQSLPDAKKKGCDEQNQQDNLIDRIDLIGAPQDASSRLKFASRANDVPVNTITMA